MKKLNYKRVAKRICSVTLAASLVCTSASYLGISENAEVAQAYNTNNENHVNAYLNNIPLIILYNTSFEGSMIPGDESKDYVKEGLGDWNLEGVTADDTSQVLFKKVLTTPTNRLSAFYTLPNNGINSFIGAQNFSFYKGKNADVKLSDVWAQMLITSMSTENGDGYLTDDGYYCTEPQYGINRLEAYESAVENDSYLTDKSISDNKLRKRSAEDQCIKASTYLQAYCRGVVGWGRDDTVYQYIKNTYGPNKSDEMKDNTPCYCMIVINKTGLIDSNMNFGLENKTPYVYVLYFHDFEAARLTQEYLESAGDDIEVGDTLEDLAKKGITCTGSAVQQYLDEKNGNTSISYDIIEKENGKIYTSKNEAGTEANVSTTYEFSQGETLSVTEESSYTKSVSQELAASGTVSYKFDYGVAGEMGVEFGISTTHSETQEYTKGSGQGYEKSTVETSSAQYSQNMPPHTQNSIVVRPSDTTISYKYTSAVEPRYLTDILMFNPKISIMEGDESAYFFANWNSKKDTWAKLVFDNVGFNNNAPVNKIENTNADMLFEKLFLNYKVGGTRPSSSEDWLTSITDNGSGEAGYLLGQLYFNRPILPYGGTFTYTNCGVSVKAMEFEPLYPLEVLKPSVNDIELKVGETYNLDDVKVSAKDYSGIDWYGFNQDTAGKWIVDEGENVKIYRNKAGNVVVEGSEEGEAIIRYIPTELDAKQVSKDLDSRGITVKVVANEAEATKEPEVTKAPTSTSEPSGEGNKTDPTAAPTDNGSSNQSGTDASNSSANNAAAQPTAQPTATAAANSGEQSSASNPTASGEKTSYAVGDEYEDAKSGNVYAITDEGEVGFSGLGTNSKNATVPDSVKINGKSYKVTSIEEDAFEGADEVKTVVIGKNVVSIESNAFADCTALKVVKVKSKKLKSIEGDAFPSIKVTVKLPKLSGKTRKKYKKLFKDSGLKKAKFSTAD